MHGLGPMAGGVRLWPLLGLLLGRTLVEARVHSPAEIFTNLTKVIDRCYFVDRRYSTQHALKFADVDYLSCQRRCQNTTNCKFFGYSQDDRTCWLAGGDAVFTDYLAKGIITGPRNCPHPPAACVEVPAKGFPGETAEDTRVFFPSHRVPEKLECWPKNITGGFYDSCPDITVIEDTAHDWPGLCSGTHKVIVPWGETCQSYCRKKVTCSVYQVRNDTGKSCWHSKLFGGSNCYMRNPEQHIKPPIKAQRLLHGRVRVLAETTGVQILGLVKVFDENYFLNVTRDAVPACRNNCYSNIGCQWWQYSRSSGCFVEDPRTPVPFPVTRQSWRTSGDFAATVIGGEYIQHVCPGKAGLPADYGSTVTGVPTVPSTSPGLVFPSSAPGVDENAVPAGTLQGLLTIHGLYYGTLTEAQQRILGDNCTGAIASSMGISRSWVRDDAGSPGQVSMRPIVDGTHVSFQVDKKQGMTNNDVSRALLHHSFVDQVKETTQRLLSSGNGGDFATLQDVAVDSTVFETTPKPVLPACPTMAPDADGPHETNGLPWWLLALLVPAAGVLLLGGCAYLLSQRSSGKDSSARERKTKDRRSPPKGRKHDGGEVPLLSTSTSVSSVASQPSDRDQIDQSANGFGNSLPPPSPPNLREMQEEETHLSPLLADNYDAARHSLQGAFHAASAAQVTRGVSAQATMDARTSVLNAAFDIMDANKDGVIDPAEFQKYDYGPGVPGMRPPSLAAPSLGPRPATGRPPMFSRGPGLQPPVLQAPRAPAPAAALATSMPRPAPLPVQSVPVAMQGAPFALRR
uniref:Calmodulin n=1 Tax=Alexandrium monilatum TaxID=311494 RepID=A0A7S4WAZ9_9DINO